MKRPRATSAGSAGRAGSGLTVALASTAVFLIALEITIISVALPEIELAFPASSRATLAWIFTAYNVGVAALMLIAGWAAERWGRRRVFLIGMAVFAAGSLLSGLAPTIAALIGGRVVQAVGGAMLIPASLALILHGVPADRRDAAIGVWGAMAGLAAAVGPTLGALLVDWAGWRWVFLINVPIAAAAWLIGPRVLAESRDADAGSRVDLVAPPLGAAGVAVGVAAILAASARGVTDPVVVGGLVLGVAMLAGFLHRSKTHPRPLFPVELLGRPSYRVAGWATLVFGAGFAGWLVLAPTYLVEVRGFGVLGAGLGIAPAPLAMAVVARPAGELCLRFGHRRVITAGALLGAAATGWMVLTVTETSPWATTFVPGAVALGVSVGIGFPMLTAAAMRDVEPNRFAIGAAGNTTIRQVAIAVGIAIAVALVGGDHGTQAGAANPAQALADFRLSWLVCGALFVATAGVVAKHYPEHVGDPNSAPQLGAVGQPMAIDMGGRP